jgi:hypothetical protein
MTHPGRIAHVTNYHMSCDHSVLKAAQQRLAAAAKKLAELQGQGASRVIVKEVGSVVPKNSNRPPFNPSRFGSVDI